MKVSSINPAATRRKPAFGKIYTVNPNILGKFYTPKPITDHYPELLEVEKKYPDIDCYVYSDLGAIYYHPTFISNDVKPAKVVRHNYQQYLFTRNNNAIATMLYNIRTPWPPETTLGIQEIIEKGFEVHSYVDKRVKDFMKKAPTASPKKVTTLIIKDINSKAPYIKELSNPYSEYHRYNNKAYSKNEDVSSVIDWTKLERTHMLADGYGSVFEPVPQIEVGG